MLVYYVLQMEMTFSSLLFQVICSLILNYKRSKGLFCFYFIVHFKFVINWKIEAWRNF